MDAGELRTRMLAQLGMRIESEMSNYMLRQLDRHARGGASFPVMGGDARTGAPVRRHIVPGALSASPPPPTAPLS